MHSQLFNTIEIDLKLELKGPLLIKEGRLGDQEKGDGKKNWKEYHEKWIENSGKNKEEFPNAFFVFLNPKRELEQKIRSGQTNPVMEFYVPGSSLRGVFRSHLEKIVQSVSPARQSYSCNPFDDNNNSPTLACNKRLAEKSNKVKYDNLCIVCKIFGTTQFKTRFFVSDGEIRNFTTSLRDGIAIDRFTGGVKKGHNYKLQVLESGEIYTRLKIVNFEKWQLGLFAFLFRDLESELLYLGSGKSRGFGKIKGEIESVRIRYLGDSPQFIKGIEDIVDSLKKLDDHPSYNWNTEWREYKSFYEYQREKHFPSNTSIVEDDFWRWCAEYWLACLNQSKNTSEKDKKIFLTIDELREKDKEKV